GLGMLLQRMLNPLKSHFHRINITLFVKSHRFDTGFALMRLRLIERSAMINNIVSILVRDFDNRMMSRTGSDILILFQNGCNAFKRAKRTIGYRVGDFIIWSGPAAF